jgi:hypothetical protein
MKPLTKDQLRDNAAAMLAFADGKPIEYDSSSGETPSWCGTTDITYIQTIWHRPKPQPVSRPWSKPEDVPLNCWLNAPSVNNQAWLVNGVIESGVYSAGGLKTWSELHQFRYSTDRKTWKPCTVEDAQ